VLNSELDVFPGIRLLNTEPTKVAIADLFGRRSSIHAGKSEASEQNRESSTFISFWLAIFNFTHPLQFQKAYIVSILSSIEIVGALDVPINSITRELLPEDVGAQIDVETATRSNNHQMIILHFILYSLHPGGRLEDARPEVARLEHAYFVARLEHPAAIRGVVGRDLLEVVDQLPVGVRLAPGVGVRVG
jgi:hypothetical protein